MVKMEIEKLSQTIGTFTSGFSTQVAHIHPELANLLAMFEVSKNRDFSEFSAHNVRVKLLLQNIVMVKKSG